MRKHKFRGINHENGEFVYGYHTRLQEGARRFDAIVSEDEDFNLTVFYIHDKKTITEYTGLKDKNGVEIYEGDIFLHDKKGEFLVAYQDANFRLVDKRFNKSLSAGCINLSGKVIGNIYQKNKPMESKQ